MPDIPDSNWSERDEKNAENAPDGFPPGLPAQIELIGQMVMGAIKRFWNKINPAYATTGTGDNYVVTPEGNTVFLNLYEIIRVRINRANTTATPTLKFGRTNARVIVKVSTTGIVPLIAGDLIAGQDHSFWFNGTNFILSNPGTIDSSVTVGLLKAANNLSDVLSASTSLANIGGMAKATYDPQNIQADAFARANQTGTQAQSTIVNLVSDLALKAPLASPALTGNPTAPTQAPGDNSTKLATTAYVDLKANIASPTFTGDPKAPTPSAGDNDTSIATTAFVTAALAAVGARYALLQDQKASGTVGGGSSSGWQTRVINTEVFDPSNIVSISSNTFTPTVDCYCAWITTAYATGPVLSRIWNVTDSVEVARGANAYTLAAQSTGANPSGECRLTAGKTYRLEMYAASAQAGNGLGNATSNGGVEVYSNVFLRA